MATFAELCDDVYTITNRPDLIAETKLAVKAATLKFHQADYWFKDIAENGVQFTDAAYTQQVDMKSLFPRFRSLSYFRRYDNSGSGQAAEFYKILTPDAILDSYSQERVGIAYMAGSVLNIKSKNLLQYALTGFYQNPNITEAGFSSWIAEDHPYAIVYEAARVLFKQIGFDEQSSQFEKLTVEQFAEIRISNTVAVGY